MDAMIHKDDALRSRLAPLKRNWNWLFTGPLEFGRQSGIPAGAYVAGDALSFVDPFTGSGLLCALLTGSLAGRAAASGLPLNDYARQCSHLLKHPFRFSSVLRGLAATPAAGALLRMFPSALIFRWTRP